MVVLEVASDYEIVVVYVNTAVDEVILHNYEPYHCQINNLKLAVTVGVILYVV